MQQGFSHASRTHSFLFQVQSCTFTIQRSHTEETQQTQQTKIYPKKQKTYPVTLSYHISPYFNLLQERPGPAIRQALAEKSWCAPTSWEQWWDPPPRIPGNASPWPSVPRQFSSFCWSRKTCAEETDQINPNNKTCRHNLDMIWLVVWNISYFPQYMG